MRIRNLRQMKCSVQAFMDTWSIFLLNTTNSAIWSVARKTKYPNQTIVRVIFEIIFGKNTYRMNYFRQLYVWGLNRVI